MQGNSTTAATDLELVPSPNLPKNEDSRQPQCPEDKESAIVEPLSKKPPLQNQRFKWWEHVTVWIRNGKKEKRQKSIISVLLYFSNSRHTVP